MPKFLLRIKIDDCPRCGAKAELKSEGSPQPQSFPFAVICSSAKCGIRTPWMKEAFLALSRWNRK